MFPGASNDLRCLFSDRQSISCALEELHRFDVHLPKSLHPAYVVKHVHADRKSCSGQPLFLRSGVDNRREDLRNEVESRTDREMVHIDVVRLGVGDHDVVTFHGDFGKPSVF